MSHRLPRMGHLALLVPILAACAGKPLVPTPGAARYETELARAASVITPEAVLTNISVIADDSMGGRNTPSVGLEKTAEYFAARYQEWGIKPAGENGTYFQRYPLGARGIDQSAAYVELNENGTVTRYPMGQYAYVTGGGIATATSFPGVLLAGALTADAIRDAGLKGKAVFAVYDATKAVQWRNLQLAIQAAGPAAIILLQNTPMAQFGRSRDMAATPRMVLMRGDGSGTPIFTVNDSLFARDAQAANRPDFNQLRASPTAVIQPLPAGMSLSFYAPVKVYRQVDVPNVVGMIEGSDPVLKNEYVIYSAHMDHVGTAGDGVGGCRAKGADSICNGADDDASGSTGLLLIAKAYSQLKVKPRRSIVFLHVSGEEKGLLGSSWYADHPTVPVANVVANINTDMIGRNNPDSIVVIGKEHSDMGVTLARVSARHPELHLIAADDIWPEERFYFRSDHFNFARKGIPVLFFFNGVHPQYHQADDHVSLIDTSKLSRVAKMAFYLGAEIANTSQRPAWNPTSYKEIVEGPGR